MLKISPGTVKKNSSTIYRSELVDIECALLSLANKKIDATLNKNNMYAEFLPLSRSVWEF